jgi:hypothetical protein
MVVGSRQSAIGIRVKRHHMFSSLDSTRIALSIYLMLPMSRIYLVCLLGPRIRPCSFYCVKRPRGAKVSHRKVGMNTRSFSALLAEIAAYDMAGVVS